MPGYVIADLFTKCLFVRFDPSRAITQSCREINCAQDQNLTIQRSREPSHPYRCDFDHAPVVQHRQHGSGRIAFLIPRSRRRRHPPQTVRPQSAVFPGRTRARTFLPLLCPQAKGQPIRPEHCGHDRNGEREPERGECQKRINHHRKIAISVAVVNERDGLFILG